MKVGGQILCWWLFVLNVDVERWKCKSKMPQLTINKSFKSSLHAFRHQHRCRGKNLTKNTREFRAWPYPKSPHSSSEEQTTQNPSSFNLYLYKTSEMRKPKLLLIFFGSGHFCKSILLFGQRIFRKISLLFSYSFQLFILSIGIEHYKWDLWPYIENWNNCEILRWYRGSSMW